MIYIVNHVNGGYYTEIRSSYHLVESEAQKNYEATLLRVGEDPTVVELVRLNTSTLESVTLKFFEGTIDNIEDEEDEEPVV